MSINLAVVMHILASHRKTFIPDLICGDFDSAKQEVLRFYENEVCAYGFFILHI